MAQGGYAYILTNQRHTVLCTGITANFPARIEQYRTKAFPKSFTARHNVEKLIYFRSFPTITEAIAEEKRLKGGSRRQKIDLRKALILKGKTYSSVM